MRSTKRFLVVVAVSLLAVFGGADVASATAVAHNGVGYERTCC